MVSFNTEEWSTWVAAAWWPFLRVWGMVLADPIMGYRRIPLTVRGGLAVVITAALLPALPIPSPAPIDASAGALIASQQLVIGLTIGFVVRIALAAAEFAGRWMGVQMGIGTGALFDPQTGPPARIVERFAALFAAVTFLSLNGHLVVLGALAESFQRIPIGLFPPSPLAFRLVAEWGGSIFAIGLLIALPMLVTLLIAHIALGVMARAVPPAHLLSIGLPTLPLVGLVALALALPYLQPELAALLEQTYFALARVIDAMSLTGE